MMVKKSSIPRVSVVVVTRNEAKNISSCLDSLISQELAKEEYEIVVVDGASTDNTQEICRRYPIRLVAADKGSIPYQRNLGVQAARGEYLAFTDGDCIAEKTWLTKLVEQMDKESEDTAAVGGPNFVLNDDPPLGKVVGYAQESFLGSGGSPQSYRIDKAKYVMSIPNCNILYRKQIIAGERYDETLVLGGDAELNFRLRQKGYKFLYLPNAIVWHSQPSTIKAFAKKMFRYGEGIARITKKHKRVIRWYAFAVAVAVLAVIFCYPIITFSSPAKYIYAVALCVYIILLIYSTVQVYGKCKSPQSLSVIFLLPVQHFTYGSGFLRELLRRQGKS